MSRGFYLSGYPGTNLDQVTLYYGGTAAGTYMITLTARAGTYDGPIIATGTVSASIPDASGNALTPVRFAFGAAPVTRGSTVTFTQSSSGPGSLFFNGGVPPCPGVARTNGTSPPLSTFREGSVGLTITEIPSNSFSLGAIKRNKKKGTATLALKVPHPGELTASGNGVRASSTAGAVTSKAVRAGKAKLLIKAKGKKKRKLNETGKVKLKLTITYTPTGGSPKTKRLKVKLRKAV